MKTFITMVGMSFLLVNCSKTPETKEDSTQNSSQVVAPTEETVRIIAEQTEPDTLKGSLKAKAMGTIGDVGMTVNYYSPAVRGRIIWGGLVPFGNVWVTGAHRATSIEFDQEVLIENVKIGPGKFGLFTIPGKDQWTVIINKNWDQHLADDYNQAEDIVRVLVKPLDSGKHQERLMFTIESGDNGGGIVFMSWEKLRIPLKIQIAG